MKIFESNPTDARYTEQDLCPTIIARYGTGGGNVPLIVHGSQDPIVQEDQANTVQCNGGLENCVLDPVYCISENVIGRCETNGPNGKGWLEDQSFTINASGVHAVSEKTEVIPINTMCVQGRPSDNGRMGSGIGMPGDPANTISAQHSHGVFDTQSRVRKLTPIECERLQGFPDDWTKIPYRGKPESQCPDSPRYKAIGNSMAVPVMRWIGKRIQQSRRDFEK